MLIAQHRPHITHFVRNDDGAWSYSEVNSLDARLYLPSVGVTLKLSDVYQKVEFEASSGPTALLPQYSAASQP